MPTGQSAGDIFQLGFSFLRRLLLCQVKKKNKLTNAWGYENHGLMCTKLRHGSLFFPSRKSKAQNLSVASLASNIPCLVLTILTNYQADDWICMLDPSYVPLVSIRNPQVNCARAARTNLNTFKPFCFRESGAAGWSSLDCGLRKAWSVKGKFCCGLTFLL